MPTSPSPSPSSNGTQIATTEFVKAVVSANEIKSVEELLQLSGVDRRHFRKICLQALAARSLTILTSHMYQTPFQQHFSSPLQQDGIMVLAQQLSLSNQVAL
jgi:hypothetical protein